MAQRDSRRLSMVLPHLYPDLKNDVADGDYHLQNDTNGEGTYVVWKNNEIPEPTAQQLADAKEDAVNASWWKGLRSRRDRLLKASDWSQGTDIPSALKNSYATYRQELRDLPAAVTKPSFETLNNQSVNEWNIDALMPTKPEDN